MPSGGGTDALQIRLPVGGRKASVPCGIARLTHEVRRRLADADNVADTLPHRAKYLRLSHRLAGRVLDASEQWLDELERELAGA